MKDLSIEDQIYLCKYHDIDTCLNLTLGLNQKEAKAILEKLKQNGLYEQYRMLSEDEYENIVKQENKKDKYTKILDRYKFDKTKRAYKNLTQILKMFDMNMTRSKEFSLEKAYRKIAEEQNVKTYIINNDCKRLLDSTYKEHEELFKQNKYDKKPTLKEFILKELNLGVIYEKHNNANEEKIENINENVENSTEKDKSINSQFIADIDNTYVKVSVRTVAEWAYQKRIFGQNVRGK